MNRFTWDEGDLEHVDDETLPDDEPRRALKTPSTETVGENPKRVIAE